MANITPDTQADPHIYSLVVLEPVPCDRCGEPATIYLYYGRPINKTDPRLATTAILCDRCLRLRGDYHG